MRWLPIALLLMAGCARTVYVPQQTVRTESRETVRYDSVRERDSIFVRISADTMYIHRDRWRDRYHLIRDTVVVRDSISRPVIVEVEKSAHRVPALYRLGLWIAVAAVSWVVWKLFRR